MHVPRYTYLPLLIPEIREHLVELCLDDEQLEATKEAEWWFEEDPRGADEGQGVGAAFASQGPCKWYDRHESLIHPPTRHGAPKARVWRRGRVRVRNSGAGAGC